ncbi:type VI secretion ATPase, ClpV1 family (plasmid) [Gemmatirosa kalamazoonensis]|uniref:Type VI secretion ATPase, ClpV1 family n=1 Tax=Gemmatirosa kalamazoonensis TaxID=861299 RepID=W0RQJ6_9BACT|nr:type VI secretion system ATPase TssH [Gemmatirosa kalamazoonensis]AHG92996.1 type VI secretion ATPase, ClpV1 family [Gemmatirosa kalamazoonensis]
MSVNLRSLIGKLNPATRGCVESAAGLCLSRTHYDVEIEHFLTKALDATDGDLATILKHYGVNRSRLADDLARGLDRLKSGNARTPSLSPSLVKMLTEAWTIGSIDFTAPQVRIGHCVLALLTNDELSRLAKDVSREFEKIPAEALKKDFATVTAPSTEAAGELGIARGGGSAAAGAPNADGTPKVGGRTPNLDQYTVDLTARAKAGKIDPVLGRDFEIRQVVDILTRRRQNNPILVGEAGVGKTAVVEGFALRIVQGDVPQPLKNVTVRTLDLALLQAGAGVKGEFENRLKGLIEEVKNSASPIILFIDEAHTMIGAGGQAGQGDAANLLKPALARGELRTLAATTWAEYKKFFEKDPALSRRFQLVKVEEPSEDVCLLMMRGVVPALEAHHTVRVTDDGLDAAVRLSHRYLPDRQLPDKAVSVLDTACARLALGQQATPAPIEDARRRLDDLGVQARVLDREAALGIDHTERLAAIAAQRTEVEAQLAALEARWTEESGLVEKIRGIRAQLEEAHTNGDSGLGTPDSGTDSSPESRVPSPDELRTELAELTAKLEAVQGETPLMRVAVDASIIGEVISGWTGVPVGKMVRDQLSTMLELERHLGARVIGQDHALEAISKRIRTSAAKIEDPNKPKGVFMLVGPSGVGKTETALALGDLLYGGEQNVITINMSEFQEAHTVSTLKGSPPGYVGYGEGGVLTEAVRRKPYSVVLLDEVEKAHPDVLELFFQVFDKGRMEDGEGREIDFKNTIILLTTNAGTETIMTLTGDPETMPSVDGLAKALKPELDKTFKPAFLGRMVVIPYFPVRDENLKKIVRLKLGKIERRLRETHKVTLVHDHTLIDAVAARCTEVESGARNVDNILTNTMLPEIGRRLLEAIADGTKPGAIRVTVDDAGELSYEVTPAARADGFSLAPAAAAAAPA